MRADHPSAARCGPCRGLARDAPGARLAPAALDARRAPGPRRAGALGRATRRALLAVIAIALGVAPATAEGKKVKVGVLKLTSSAPLFLGVERGTFREFGIEPELVYFQAAQPVAVAIAAGEVEVGATGLTAGLYNIVAGGEKVWVVADKGREWPATR
jgi:hypothetical protein